MGNGPLAGRLRVSMAVILAAIVGTAIATLLTSADWTFAAVLVGAIAVVRVFGDLIAWERDRRKDGV